jgi:hypothetical protein
MAFSWYGRFSVCRFRAPVKQSLWPVEGSYPSLAPGFKKSLKKAFFYYPVKVITVVSDFALCYKNTTPYCPFDFKQTRVPDIATGLTLFHNGRRCCRVG